MDNRMLNSVLESQELKVDALGNYSQHGLNKSDDEGYFGAVLDEAFRLVVCVFHDHHSSGYFRVEYNMEGQSAWILDEEESKRVGHFAVIFVSTSIDLINHAIEHGRCYHED